VLVIADTTDIRLDNHLGRITDLDGIGILDKNQHKASYGFLLHPLYVVDEADGTPYGIADVKLFNRPFDSSKKSKAQKKRRILRTSIEKKESYRWLGPCLQAKQTTLGNARRVTYVMDREADIWELYQRIPQQGADLVIRCKTNRQIINDQGEKIRLRDQLSSQESLGDYQLSYKDSNGTKRTTQIQVKAGKCMMSCPKHKRGKSTKSIYYVEVKGLRQGPDNQGINWILWTSREVTNIDQAIQIVDIYKRRWQIEVFFKLLKSDGYDIENCQLEKGKSIRKLTLILMEAALKVLQLKAARSGETELQVSDLFGEDEIRCLQNSIAR